MTIGSFTHNLEYTPPGACGGAGNYRKSFLKQWNGADLTPAERSAGKPYPNHAYSCVVEKLDRGRCLYKPTQSISLVSNCFGGWSNPDAAWDSNDELKLLGKLGDKIRDHDFNAGVFAGTGHQTAALIGSSAERLANGIRALKKGLGPGAIVNALNGATAKTTSKGRALPFNERNLNPEHRDVELSRRWLEASYGWMPLLSDTHEAAKALAHHVQRSQQKQFTVRQRGKMVNLYDNDGYRSRQQWAVRRHQLIYTFERESDLPSEFVTLGLTDPYSIAWELVPWSFAIDWFLPIGSMLRSASLIPRLKGRWCRTVTRRNGGRIRAVHPSYTHLDDYLIVKHEVLSRTTGTALTVPLPRFKSPISKSWIRAANQIALLGALRSRY